MGTVTEDNEKSRSDSCNINGKYNSGSSNNDSQPALKLKLITKNKYEEKLKMECTSKKLAHENTLAGAIELKKRLLKERKRAKRERTKKSLLNSDDNNETKVTQRP